MLSRLTAGTLLLAVLASAATEAVRLKDLASIEGVRDNQLAGYGLIVGLAGTGDRRQTVFSAQTLANALQRMGVSVPPTAMRVNNVAAVMITATLPPFAQPGTRIDVTAAAIGDATNLQGGLLLMTPLRGADGQVYAVGQGPLITGGFSAGRGGNTKTMNHPTVGRVPNGAIVERGAPSVLSQAGVRLQLRHSDFTTAARIASAINEKYAEPGQRLAKAENSALVAVAFPAAFREQPTEFVAALEALTVEADRSARIVLNERTGTIVMGKEVRISSVAVMHGALTVEIQTTYQVSQPAPLSGGSTEVVPAVGVGVKEEQARNLVLQQGASVEDLVRALNAIGSTPRDIIAILQSLRAAGALQAELEII
jgi:flagellar P-ring protein precursor FlgI